MPVNTRAKVYEKRAAFISSEVTTTVYFDWLPQDEMNLIMLNLSLEDRLTCMMCPVY